ncbi:MAG: RNA helicase [Acetobacter sp.]|nr:RNA helicase [Acetobacter sp.]
MPCALASNSQGNEVLQDRDSLIREALAHAIQRTGFSPKEQEESEILREIARVLSPQAHDISDELYCRTLILVRKRKRVTRLLEYTRAHKQLWITREDIEEAVESLPNPLHTPYLTDEILQNALTSVVKTRLRGYGKTPRKAFNAMRADLVDAGLWHTRNDTRNDTKGGNTRSLTLIKSLLKAIAEAFDLSPNDPFVKTILQEERERQERERAIQQIGSQRRKREEEQLSAWEASLVPFKEVPHILQCSYKEALRWVAENRIPVARKRRESDGYEQWEFDPAQLIPLRAHLVQWRQKGRKIKLELRSLKEKSSSSKALEEQGRRVANAVIARVAALDRYAAHFRTARALQRRITLITGPTNSGKSHAALDALARAQSGLGLVPLRLLAHEFRESLAERGVEASLLTGEERITVPMSRHLVATVEMCPYHTPVDVAIIDEAQMLFDPDRGAAWTAALMGVPARHLYVLGAAECIPMVRRIAELCDDPLDEISLERKTPLQAASHNISLKNLKRGDALVAFSRREVLDLRAELVRQGRRVAVVYGALSPEVRRAEAQRFNSGQAEILIATDAIGMGLNLSIKRVVFASLSKYDGRHSRDLHTQEVKQIGGRAGRYGKNEAGIVAVLSGAGSPAVVRRHLETPAIAPDDMRPFVQPDVDIVKAVASEMDSQSLYGVLSRIRRAVLRKDDPNYRLADMEQAFAIASALEGVEGLDLATRWSYAMCPIDDRDNGIYRLVGWAADHASGRNVPPPGTGRLCSIERAGPKDLEQAEKRYKRLVAWRWLALRFPEFYQDYAEAEETTRLLNEWIENVLRYQSRTKHAHKRLRAYAVCE